MNLSERSVRNQKRLVLEHQRPVKEHDEKKKAQVLAKESQTEIGAVEERLKESEEEKRKVQESLSQITENLNTEQGIFASLKEKLEEMKKNLSDMEVESVKINETLERVEKEALITYDDCVKKYKGSQCYIDELETKAGAYHEEGYNDCLGFIGTGNVVDLRAHSIDEFWDAEIAKYEAAKPKARGGVGPEGTGDTQAAEGGTPGDAGNLEKDGKYIS